MVDRVAQIATDAGAGRLMHTLRRLVGKAGPDAGFGNELAEIEGYSMGA